MKVRARPYLGWTVLVATCVLVAALQACQPQARAGHRPDGRWTVTFRDTFDGTKLDAERWNTCHWWNTGDGCTITGNGERQWYGPHGVAVRAGRLELTAVPEPSVHEGSTFSYASGMVSSGRSGDEPGDRARHAFTFGSVEVRFRAPKGAGLWPAIWMLPVTNESLPEIDILEQYGEGTRTASMTVHAMEGSDQVKSRHYEQTDDLSEGWHTVGIDWSEDSLIWFLDGREVYRVTGNRVPREPMYLVMNLAVRGGEHAPTEATAFPARLLVDEVTIWRQS